MCAQLVAIDIVHELTTLLSSERVSVTTADRSLHAVDQSAHTPHMPDIVLWPETTAEVSNILKLANQQRLPVTAWGAGTSIEGNPIPVRGGLLLNMQRMSQILAVHENDFQVTVQPGLYYKDMNRMLAQYGLFFPPDPGANASIGGMLANNAAGIRTVKYGATRENVLALEVVLANGQIIRTGSRSVKQSSGYDLTHLIVGSEGTLGIITEATLKLYPIPAFFSAATAVFPTVQEAAQVVYEIIGSGLEPNALELLDETAVAIINTDPSINLVPGPNLFMEFSSASENSLGETMAQVQAICEESDCLNFGAGIGQDARKKLWEARHRLFEIHLHHFPGEDFLLADVSVPISQYPTLAKATAQHIADLGLKGSIISHAGDGNLHTAVFFPHSDTRSRDCANQLNKRLVELALALGGTSTGEHGVGIGKAKYMAQEHGPALEVMRQIKRALDPNGILNPGKIFPE
jgi:D-lactate dehydrogenase (cytochrome)